MSEDAYPGINYLLYSGQFANDGVWAKGNLVAVDVTAQISDGPNNYVNRILVTNQAPTQYIDQYNNGQNYHNDQFYSFTIWFQQETFSGTIAMSINDTAGGGVVGYFNPSQLGMGATTPCNVIAGSGVPWQAPAFGVTALPNNWYAISLSGYTPTTGSLGMSVELSFSNAPVGQSFLLAGATLYVGLNQNYIDTGSAPTGNSLPIFVFPLHKLSTMYPANSMSVQFGGSYIYTVGPNGPPQRTFTLKFNGLKWYWNSDGTVDVFTNSGGNVGALDTFYQKVQTHLPFYYIHQVYGRMIVRFSKPLQIPETSAGSPFDVTGPLTVELIEMP